MSKNKYTKESIKARMYGRIATLWNIRNVDDLDPVVKLLVESLASEVFSLSGELDTIENRIVEKLARAFTPSFMMAASPAHAVLHARSISGCVTIDPRTEFVYKEPRFVQRHNLRKLSMTPVCNTAIFDADVVSVIADYRYDKITPRGGKDHIAGSTRRDPVFNNTVWIGIEAGSDVRSLKNMAFYFEFPFMDNCEEYLRLLEYGKWSVSGKEIITSAGLTISADEKSCDVFELYDQKLYMHNEIKGKYNRHFVTITEDVDVREAKRESLPEELLGLFAGDFVQGLRKDIIWFKLVLPAAFDSHGVSNMAVHTNCFPVANIYCKKIVATVTPLSSIVMLEKERNEYFLFVDSVMDSGNREYKQVRTHEDNQDIQTYVIRRGGSERFNTLDARDFLERLLDIYRDESIAFSSIDKDIAGTAEGLMEYLSDFERKLKSYDSDTEHTSYLILGGDIEERANITVRYNMTNGAIANDIKAAEMLSVPEAGDIAPASAVLMTATRGGRKSPPESSQQDIYQYMLTSRDRIYTREDVRLFCRSYYGECFSDVEIENGYEVSSKPKEGIIRTTNVILHGSKGDTNVMAEEMLAGLQQRSADGVNYRIKLK